MKKISFFLLLVLLCVINSFGQTTLEEYNYITKGYKAQIENGLGMKEGYRLESLGWWGLYQTHDLIWDVKFYGLYRKGETTPCALMMIFIDLDTYTTQYVCIPHPDSDEEIWDLTLDYIDQNISKASDISKAKLLIWALMHFASQEATE